MTRIMLLCATVLSLSACENSKDSDPSNHLPANKGIESARTEHICETAKLKDMSEYENHKDYGERMHELGRPAVGKPTYIYLGETCFQASVGASTYQDEENTDPDYYTIQVLIEATDRDRPGGSIVMAIFERQFHISNVPKSILSKTAKEVTAYDPAAMEVSFTIGENVYKYKHPKP